MNDNPQSAASLPRAKRIEGALLGLYVGDALGLGYHWYYDLNMLESDVGSWVFDYIDPVVRSEHSCRYISQYRFDQGLRAGNYSQNGQIILLLLESIVREHAFNVSVFGCALDELFKELDGEALSGRYTEGIVRDAWRKRREGVSWEDARMAADADISLGAQLCVVLATLYRDPLALAKTSDQLLSLFYRDRYLRACQIVYALTIQALIKGTGLAELPDVLTALANNNEILKCVGSYSNLQQPGLGKIAECPEMVSIEPAKYVSLLFGLDCQATHLLPAAYYLIYRYPESFEMAVLSASNGGGDNLSRAALTGALAGAFHGVDAIPERFLNTLENVERIRGCAQAIA